MDLQFIGIDPGRGCNKAYTEYNGKTKSFICQSIVGEGREIDYSSYNDEKKQGLRRDEPLHLIINGNEVFVGGLAEKESHNPMPNYADDKTSYVAENLIYTSLYALAESEFVSICIGVPYKEFNAETMAKVAAKYNGKKITIVDKTSNKTKIVNIVRSDIYREADAALYHIVTSHPNKAELINKHLGVATVGFRTFEKSYYDPGMNFNDKLSDTSEFGNKTVLETIKKTMSKQGISKELHEIDNDSKYDSLKKMGYSHLVERINQEVEMNWTNWREMTIFLAGGTTLNFDDVPAKFTKVTNPQFATAKGLFYIAEKRG